MPRYYFHFVSTTDNIFDPHGVALDNLRAAHLHALRLIRQTVSLARGMNLRRWQVRVVDETQSVVLIVLFPAEVRKGEFGRRVAPIPDSRIGADSIERTK